MAIKNITSMIKPEKTIMEIERILIDFGARGILKEYSGKRVDSLSFYIERDGQKIPFKMPMKIESARRMVEKAVNDRKLPNKFKNEPFRTEKAESVGWRVIKDWIHSQLSLIEIQFADPIELLLAYVYDSKTNKTFFEKIQKNPQMLLDNKQ